MKPAFISYVKEDEKQVLRICNTLKLNGISYWIDKEQLYPGDFWKSAIESAIKDGGLFLAFFSHNSVRREKSYMREEMQVAISVARQLSPNAKWIIPIKLSECDIPDYQIAPGVSLSQIQYIEMFTNFDENMARLLASLGVDTKYQGTEKDVYKEQLFFLIHDVNNALNGVYGYSLMAQRCIDSNPTEAKKFISKQLEVLHDFMDTIKSHIYSIRSD